MTEPGIPGNKYAYVIDRFVLEDVAHQRRDPLFVGLRRSCVPAIQAIKLQLHVRYWSIRQSI